MRRASEQSGGDVTFGMDVPVATAPETQGFDDTSGEGFDEWYSQAFEGTKVASFNALEALSIDKHVQDLTKPDNQYSSGNDDVARY